MTEHPVAADAGAIDVFLSYAKEDRARIAVLAAAMADEGWIVWWDRELRSGDDWRREIQRALSSAKCVVVAWTGASVESDFVQQEASDAKGRGVLLPVLLDAVAIPLGLRSTQAERLIGWHGAETDRRLFRFLETVGAAIDKEPDKPRFIRRRRLLLRRWAASILLPWFAFAAAAYTLDPPASARVALSLSEVAFQGVAQRITDPMPLDRLALYEWPEAVVPGIGQPIDGRIDLVAVQGVSPRGVITLQEIGVPASSVVRLVARRDGTFLVDATEIDAVQVNLAGPIRIGSGRTIDTTIVFPDGAQFVLPASSAGAEIQFWPAPGQDSITLDENLQVGWVLPARTSFADPSRPISAIVSGSVRLIEPSGEEVTIDPQDSVRIEPIGEAAVERFLLLQGVMEVTLQGAVASIVRRGEELVPARFIRFGSKYRWPLLAFLVAYAGLLWWTRDRTSRRSSA